MAKTLQAVFALNDKYTMTMRKILQSQDTFENKQKSALKVLDSFSKHTSALKGEAETGSSGIASLAGQIGGLVSVAYIGKKALDGMFGAINASALQQVQETTFQALLNSEKIGSQLYAYVGKYAKTSALGREDIAKGVTTFLTVTRDMAQIEQLIKMTERLYAKDPTQGAEGAVFALKEALSGDTISLRNRYGITGLSGESLRAGDAASKIEQIDAVLNQFGATQAVVDKNFNNLTTQVNIFKSNFQTAMGEEATPVTRTLTETMIQLNQNMEAGKYQPFFNLMANGMRVVGTIINFVAMNADTLAKMLGTVVGAVLIYNTVMKTMAIVTAVTGAVAQITTKGLWGIVGAVGAVVAAGAMIGIMSKQFGELEKSTPDLSSLGANLATTSIPCEITNEDPLKVSGEVEIEEESLRYAMDLAGMKYFSKFSNTQNSNQVVVEQVVIEKTADASEVLRIVTEEIESGNEAGPDGDY